MKEALLGVGYEIRKRTCSKLKLYGSIYLQY